MVFIAEHPVLKENPENTVAVGLTFWEREEKGVIVFIWESLKNLYGQEHKKSQLKHFLNWILMILLTQLLPRLSMQQSWAMKLLQPTALLNTSLRKCLLPGTVLKTLIKKVENLK